jgi:DNA-binding NtrC family response regulator
VLIVDDEPRVGVILKEVLQHEGYEVDFVERPTEALEQLKNTAFDVLITDLRMPGMNGLELLDRAKAIRPACQVIVVTAFGAVDTARVALKRGAVDYITKPFSAERELIPVLDSIFSSARQKTQRAEEEYSKVDAWAGPSKRFVLGSSEQMKVLFEVAGKVATTEATVLVRGESGTGKEVFADGVYRFSRRSKGPFVKVNCTAIPEELLESTLFGHVRGSFTGADRDHNGLFMEADGGTIFLDEIGDISLRFQAKLLRVLESGEFHRVGDPRRTRVDVRVITATNRDLEKAVKDGSFRQDLYYRLNVFPIRLPPLREHPEDIPAFVEHFATRFARDSEIVRLSEAAMDALQAYDWPGNVRELANAIEYALVLGDPRGIELSNLPQRIQEYYGHVDETLMEAEELEGTLSSIEARRILEAMRKEGNNRTRAAKLLGITRRALGYRLHKYHLESAIEEAEVHGAPSSMKAESATVDSIRTGRNLT